MTTFDVGERQTDMGKVTEYCIGWQVRVIGDVRTGDFSTRRHKLVQKEDTCFLATHNKT
jgi:hypothetical protein